MTLDWWVSTHGLRLIFATSAMVAVPMDYLIVVSLAGW